MNTLIRNGEIVDDGWQWVDAGEAGLSVRLAAGGRFLLPLAAWLAHRESLDPACADGRGYSLARLLRTRHGYTGELRAVGDVLRDQLYFLQGCGFDAFQLRADQCPEEALAAFQDYSWAPLSGR